MSNGRPQVWTAVTGTPDESLEFPDSASMAIVVVRKPTCSKYRGASIPSACKSDWRWSNLALNVFNCAWST